MALALAAARQACRKRCVGKRGFAAALISAAAAAAHLQRHRPSHRLTPVGWNEYCVSRTLCDSRSYRSAGRESAATTLRTCFQAAPSCSGPAAAGAGGGPRAGEGRPPGPPTSAQAVGGAGAPNIARRVWQRCRRDRKQWGTRCRARRSARKQECANENVLLASERPARSVVSHTRKPWTTLRLHRTSRRALPRPRRALRPRQLQPPCTWTPLPL